jgi:quercetin dioxygenase-like cupin family protein
MKRRPFRLATAIAAGGLLASAALVAASPGSGITGVSIRGDGLAAGRVMVNIPSKVLLVANRGLHVIDQELTILPGGSTGWHSHSGPVLVTVKSGTFRLTESDCSWADYSAGQTAVDQGGGDAHVGTNPSSTTDTELSITYLLPPGGAARIDVPAVACP